MAHHMIISRRTGGRKLQWQQLLTGCFIAAAEASADQVGPQLRARACSFLAGRHPGDRSDDRNRPRVYETLLPNRMYNLFGAAMGRRD
jgi:hypothetical protein